MKVRTIRQRTKTKYVVKDGMRFLRDSATKRCRTYVSGCVNCATWRFRDEHGRFAYTFAELVEFINRGELR